LKKIILVFGAAGFIGSHLTSSLAKNGHVVYGIGRGSQFPGSPSECFLESDINEEAILKLCPNPDVIINCAGSALVSNSFVEPCQDFKKTTNSLFAGLEVVRKYNTKCLFVQTSSSAVYGNQLGALPESASTQNQISPYGVYKKVCEQICEMYSQHFGLNVSILRLFSVYGAGLKKQLLWDACNKINSGDNLFFGTGEEIRDWVHINDVCNLYEKLINHNQPGISVINGGSGLGTDVKDVLKLIYQGLEIHGKPQFTQNPRQGDPNIFIANNSLAESIGWQPEITLEQGVCEYTKWFKNNCVL
jgi:UDP-glucose 4-epimerase